MSSMTMRQRMLAVVQGRPLDRVPFAQYENVCRCPVQEIWDVVGRENLGVLRHTELVRWEHPNCHFDRSDIEREGMTGWRDTLETPAGSLYQEHFRQPELGVAMIASHYVKDPKDWQIVRAYLQDRTPVKDLSQFRTNWDQLGDDGIPHTRVLTTPFQRLWIHWGRLEDVCFHMVDYPDLLGEVLHLLSGECSRVIDIAVEAATEAPIPYLNFADNLTAPIIGLSHFQKYCVPFYNELADKLSGRGLDIPICVHADGDMKGLWEAIGGSALGMLDSYTPPPDNDTPIAEAVRMWPQMRFLVNFPSSVHLSEPDKIYQRAMQILEAGGHTGRLQMQISENPPLGRWKVSYPPIIKAIEDFGPPGGQST